MGIAGVGVDCVASRAACVELALGGGDFNRAVFSRGGPLFSDPPFSAVGDLRLVDSSPLMMAGPNVGGVEGANVRSVAIPCPLDGASRPFGPFPPPRLFFLPFGLEVTTRFDGEGSREVLGDPEADVDNSGELCDRRATSAGGRTAFRAGRACWIREGERSSLLPAPAPARPCPSPDSMKASSMSVWPTSMSHHRRPWMVSPGAECALHGVKGRTSGCAGTGICW